MIELFRPLDQDQVIVPTTMRFPLAVKDYVSWREPSGHRTYLVFNDPVRNQPLGVVFERSHGSQKVPMMCEWCHSVRPQSDVALMTATASEKRRVGVHLCSDLLCKERILGAPGINDMRETLNQQEKIQRLLLKMINFSGRYLF